MTLRVLLIPLVCLVATGCTRFELKVTAYLSPDLPFPTATEPNTVAVIAKTDSEERLLEREVAKKIETLLRQRGYTVKPVGRASYVLFAFFTIDSGNTATGTYDSYVPGGIAYTNVRTNTGQRATAITHLPGHTEQQVYSYTFFTRYLGMTLYQHSGFFASTAEQRDDAVVWRATTVSSGSSSDLRSVIDYLLVGTFKYFGADTGKQVRKTVYQGNKRVRALRSGRAEHVP